MTKLTKEMVDRKIQRSADYGVVSYYGYKDSLSVVERYYPSLRDAALENELKYRKGNWMTDIQLEEEEYPEGIEGSKDRDFLRGITGTR